MPSVPLHPIATASLPWQIVLAIIAFNIVVGMISKRKQRGAKPDAKAARKEEARQRMEEARARTRADVQRKAAEQEARRSRDDARATRESEAAAAAQARRDKAKEVGKDLLGQLARELGLELPQAPKPAPPPSPADARPAPAGAPARPGPSSPARPATARGPRPLPSTGDGEHDGTLADLIAARKAAVTESAEGRSTAVPGQAVDPHAAPEAARMAASPLAGDLANAEALRKAFILKTILEKPLALQAPR